MRLKDPFSLKAADMTKRSNKPKKPRDEDSSDEVGGKEKFRCNFMECLELIAKIIDTHPNIYQTLRIYNA